MVKWNPFASMPEQYEEIRRMFEEQYKVPKSFLTQDTMERIERALMQSLRDGYIHDEYITVIDIYKQNGTLHGCFWLKYTIKI